MADEWSKPVRTNDGDFWCRSVGTFPVEVTVTASEVDIGSGHEGSSAPRDVVLRLLAAEASDRLGWVWEVKTSERGGLIVWHYPDASKEPSSNWGSWLGVGSQHEPQFQIAYWNAELTPDTLVALAHGRFLLEDALKEAQ